MDARFILTTEIQTPHVDGEWDGSWVDSFTQGYQTLGSAKTEAMRRRKSSEDIGFTITELRYSDHFGRGYKYWESVRYWRSCALTEEHGWLDKWAEYKC